MTLFHALGPFASSGGVVAAPGMVLVSPTSITHSGTSATLGANGQVTFTAVTSLSLNGCFTADFDNYVVVIRGVDSADHNAWYARLRASGSDASGSDYTTQYLIAAGTTVAGARDSSFTYMTFAPTSDDARTGNTVYLYGPFLAQPTAVRCVSARGTSGAVIRDYASTHSLSTSYDGITLYPSSDNQTGELAVYGIRS